LDAAFQALDFPGLDWGGYSREEVLDLLTEAALDSLDGTGADFAADQPITPPDPTAFFALAERDGAAAALAAWEEARFYSPDQPRDDRGRWSAGGGGGASATGGGPNPDALKGDIPSRFAAGDNPAHTAKAYGLPEDFYDDQRRMHHGASGIPDMTGAVYVNEKYDPEGKVAAAVEAKADAYKRGLYEGSRRKGYDERVRAALADAAQRAAGEAGGSAAPNDFGGGMAHAGRAELRTASAAHVREFVAKGGPATGEEVAALGNHLARLTVSQLHDLRREHGLPAAGAWRMRRPDLVNVLAERFTAHRAGTPTRAARELAAVAAGGAFTASKYAPGDSTHAVEHGRTGFTVSAHPDGRFHVWDSGLAHQGVHDTAAAAVAHAANPPAKPSPDYQPRTADVETAARQGAVADAAARRAATPASTAPTAAGAEAVRREVVALFERAAHPDTTRAGILEAVRSLESLKRVDLDPIARDMGLTARYGSAAAVRTAIRDAILQRMGTARRSVGNPWDPNLGVAAKPSPAAPAAGGGAGQTVHVYSDLAGNRTYKLGGKVIPKAKAEELLRGGATRQAHFADADDGPPAQAPVRFVPYVQPAAAGGARA
jgi:hypothetical protein